MSMTAPLTPLALTHARAQNKQTRFAALELLCSPLPLAALGLLALNDHLLKGSGLLPSWLTGKLSDFAGLFFFPLLLAALAGLLLRPGARAAAAIEIGCAAATAALFCAVKLWPRANALYEGALSAVQGGARVRNVCDPTDLIAIPMCALSVAYARSQAMNKSLKLAFPLTLGLLTVNGPLAACGTPESTSRVSQEAPGEFVPPEPPTTGNKWQSDGVTHADGSQCYVLADEECGGIDQADYLQYFEAPIFRAGAVVGTVAYAVDGSNIWAIDVSVPTAPRRLGVVAGVGRALAIAGRGDKLYVAAGDQGLIVLSIDPLNPAVLRREQTLALALGGIALDVALSDDGSAAYLAAGAKGIVPIALGPQGASAGAAIPVPGFAAGVAASGGFVYVAGCSTLGIVDVAQGQLVGSLPITAGQGQAPVPLKDVAVTANTAFVAAGRWGTFFVDVSNPRLPRLLWNRTDPNDLLYYANGVALSHGQVYIAAGDWGVDRFPVSQARDPLAKPTPPSNFAAYCTPAENPDRKPAPQFQTQLPPPRRQDPLDVVPVGDTLLAMGDASRLGVRAIDLYALSVDGAHSISGRYEEPGLVGSIAAGGGKLALAGRSSGLFLPTAQPALLQKMGPLPPGHEGARVVALAGDGRLASLDAKGTLLIEGSPLPVGDLLAPVLAVQGSHLIGLREGGKIELFELSAAGASHAGSVDAEPFRYGAAHAFAGGRLFLASGTWTQAAGYDLAAPGAAPTRLSGIPLLKEDLANPASWRAGAPRRLLVPVGPYLAEISSFGGRAAGLLHPLDGTSPERSFDLPPGAYVAGEGDPGKLWLVQGDRARYRTVLMEIDFGDFSQPPRLQSRVFLGSAVGAARLGSRLYVADTEVGVRTFELSPSGTLSLGVADLGGAP